VQVLRLVLAREGRERPPSPLVLIGHSLGGAIAIRAAADGCLENVRAVVLVEACEGTAKDSFERTLSYLHAR